MAHVTETGLDASRRLRRAIESVLAGRSAASLLPSVARMTEEYRSGGVPSAPVLAGRNDVAAYAACRMPATFAATWSALRQVRLSLASPGPSSVVDLGAGTGAASWAAVDVFGSRVVTLLEQQEVAIDLGRSLAAESGSDALASATWRTWRLASSGAAIPAAGMAVASYLLGELDPHGRADLVACAARAAPLVVLVDAGTPAGFSRILAARALLVELGMAVVAPCPHDAPCPLDGAGDWCHFSTRLERSSLHRRLKGAELAYEDEKFSFVAAARGLDLDRPAARVVRHPWIRKGMVTLSLCAAGGDVRDEVVSKRQGAQYRGARDVSWGASWPEQRAADGDRATTA